MGRAYSVQQILERKHEVLDWGSAWQAAYDRPETTGIWFVFGNSGNGKSNLLIQMARELGNKYRVLINELEEGNRLTFQNTLKRSDIAAVKQNVIVSQDSFKELMHRLERRKSPHVVIINTVQYLHDMRWPEYLRYRDKFQNTKLTIFNSHAEGKIPVGRTANQIRYDADMKIWVEGYRGISNGRYNPGGFYTIDEDKANKYWGQPPVPLTTDLTLN